MSKIVYENQKGNVGLTVLIIVIIIVALGAGIGTAYLYLKKTNSESSNTKPSNSDEATTELKTFTDSKRGFSVQYPVDGTDGMKWTLEDQTDGEGVVILGIHKNDATELAEDETKVTIWQNEVANPEQLRDELVGKASDPNETGLENEVTPSERTIGGKPAFGLLIKSAVGSSAQYFVQPKTGGKVLDIIVYNPSNKTGQTILDSIKFVR